LKILNTSSVRTEQELRDRLVELSYFKARLSATCCWLARNHVSTSVASARL
jgi:hypothetical protein